MANKDKKNTEEEIFINRDNLRDNIHQIHDDLRNAGAGYGQTGLKIFSVFYGVKLVKPNLHKLKIKEEYKKVLDWDELVKLVKSGKCEIIKYINEEVLEALFQLKEDCKKTGNRDSELGHFIFHQIPTDLSDDVWKSLILKIDKIPVGFEGNNKVNLSGKLWEYFVGRDKTAISELGAYFTDRPITNFIFDRFTYSIWIKIFFIEPIVHSVVGIFDKRFTKRVMKCATIFFVKVCKLDAHFIASISERHKIFFINF